MISFNICAVTSAVASYVHYMMSAKCEDSLVPNCAIMFTS